MNFIGEFMNNMEKPSMEIDVLSLLKGTSNNYQLIHLKMKLEKNTEN